MKRSTLTLRLYQDNKKHFRWTLTARNGRKIAHPGEGYKNRTGLAKDLALVFPNLLGRPDIKIDDEIVVDLKSFVTDLPTGTITFDTGE